MDPSWNQKSGCCVGGDIVLVASGNFGESSDLGLSENDESMFRKKRGGRAKAREKAESGTLERERSRKLFDKCHCGSADCSAAVVAVPPRLTYTTDQW